MSPANETLDTTALDESARARLKELLSKKWRLPGDHPLSGLHERKLGVYRLLVLLGPKNHVGSQYFQLYLADANGALADEPLALGLYNAGPFPAFNWVELTRYNSRLTIAGKLVDLTTNGLELQLFRLLSDLVPAGGHMMVEYDSPTQQPSEQVLTRGYPAATSHIGYLMFQVGCRSYRDWYIPEGGREGPRKLQGFKPWNDEIAREKTEALRKRLSDFVAMGLDATDEDTGPGAMTKARQVLNAL
ncbi:MAG: DUF1122 family protein [Chloroflexi bacterium]|nr:DUF1122 family protein [Chloroflexota bacterium]